MPSEVRNSRSRLADSRDVSIGNAGMSESEALQAALRLSAASETNQDEGQVDADYQLALMMQEEQLTDQNNLNDANSNRRRITANSPSSNGPNNCSMQ